MNAPYLPDAMTHWAASDPMLIKVRENIVYRVTLPDGSWAALRLHRPGYQSRAGVEAELDWTAQLARRGIPVPSPLPTTAGAMTALVEDRVASCVRWLQGDPIGAGETPLTGPVDRQCAIMHALGRLLADLHRVTDRLDLPACDARPRWDASGFCGPDPLWGRFWENPALSDADQDLLIEARDLAAARLRAFKGSFGMIHADVLRENVLAGPGGLSLIDFDDAGYGFRGYDLGTALVQSLEEPALPELVAALTEGYGADPATVAHLPLFVALRSFASAGWIVSRAEPGDPKQAFYAGRAVKMARHVLEGTAPWQG